MKKFISILFILLFAGSVYTQNTTPRFNYKDIQLIGHPWWDITAYGADPSASAANNTDYIRSAIADAPRHGTIYFPSQLTNYTVDDSLLIDKPLTLLFEPGATLEFTDDGGENFIHISSDSVNIFYGSFVGNWDTTTNFSNSVERLSGERLIFGQDITDFKMYGCYITLSGHKGVYLESSTTPLKRIHIDKCRFSNNDNHLQIANYYQQTSPNEDVYVTNCSFDTTSVDLDTPVSGGNAITFTYEHSNCKIINNVVRKTGRMALEYWTDREPLYNRNLVVNKNYFGNSGYRTFSCFGNDAIVSENTIYDTTSYVEMNGKNWKFLNNNIYYAGFYFPNTFGSYSYVLEDYKLQNNTFDSLSVGEVGIYGQYLKDVKIGENEFNYNNQDTISGTQRHAISLDYCVGVIMSDNVIRYSGALSTGFFIFRRLVGLNFVNNSVYVDDDSVATLTTYLFPIFSLKGSVIEGTKFFLNNEAIDISSGGLIYLYASDQDTITMATQSGGTWSETRVNGMKAVPVAADSVNTYLFLVSDNPTGAFANQEGKIAKYNSGGGGSWSFFTMDDYVYRDTEYLKYDHFDYPSSDKDTVVILTTGYFDVEFRNNDFDVNGVFDADDNIFIGLSSNSQSVYQEVVFDNNKPLNAPFFTSYGLNYSEYRPIHADTYNSAYYYNAGQILWDKSPTAGDRLGIICTVTGKPGTWKDFGVIDLSGTVVWNPGDLADGAGETSAGITVTGAALGDYVTVAAPYDLQDLIATAYVQATNTVEIRIQNENAGANVNLASGTWKVKVIK